jgi:hypothetical protein
MRSTAAFAFAPFAEKAGSLAGMAAVAAASFLPMRMSKPQWVQSTALAGQGDPHWLQRAVSASGAATSSWRANSSSASKGSAFATAGWGLTADSDAVAGAGVRRAVGAEAGAAALEGRRAGPEVIRRTELHAGQRAFFPAAATGALKVLPQPQPTLRKLASDIVKLTLLRDMERPLSDNYFTSERSGCKAISE